MTETRLSRVRRRAVTVPAMLVATAAALITTPPVLATAALVDLVRGRPRLPMCRVHLFVLQYLVNDSVEIVLAPLLWARAGFGTRLHRRDSVARHRRLQEWSAELLARRAERLLGLQVVIDRASREALTPGPVVMISRHASLFDASIPGLVGGREGLAVRGVVMAELLADPGFDLLYGRLGSVFIPRDDGPAARAAIGSLADALRRDDGPGGRCGAVVIFPEGRLFRSAVRDRALARLADVDPGRARRLAGLTAVLPPRPGGFGVLLDALPEADVVVLDHRGLDDLQGVVDLLRVASRRRPRTVTVTARRIPRGDIPEGPVERCDWLDARWLELDSALRADEALGPGAGS